MKLELWVNFDHKYCFLAYSLELALIFLMLVQFPSVCLLLFCKLTLCYVSPISVRLSVTVLCYVSPISVRLSVTAICNRQTDGWKITEGDMADGLTPRYTDRQTSNFL